MDKNVKIFVSVIVVLVFGIIGLVILRSNEGEVAPGQYDSFAQCLKDQGAVFYGAFWCPNCTNQKKMFGTSSKLLPYVECSTLDGNSQLAECTEKGIRAYPTWDFADGTRQTGTLSLSELAEKTSCELPGNEAPAQTTGEGASSAVE